MINPFFKNTGPIDIAKLLKLASINNTENLKKRKVKDIKDLVTAKVNEITFFHSKKYELFASKTKASFCITTENLSHLIAPNCKPIIVSNVLSTRLYETKDIGV